MNNERRLMRHRLRLQASAVTAVMVVLLVSPVLAGACEGGEEEKGNIEASATLVQFLKVVEGSAEVKFTNNKAAGNWEPKNHTVKELQKTKNVWTIKDECKGLVIKPKGGNCLVKITFKENGEAGRFISDLEMEGAPAAATVKMEGEKP